MSTEQIWQVDHWVGPPKNNAQPVNKRRLHRINDTDGVPTENNVLCHPPNPCLCATVQCDRHGGGIVECQGSGKPVYGSPLVQWCGLQHPVQKQFLFALCDVSCANDDNSNDTPMPMEACLCDHHRFIIHSLNKGPKIWKVVFTTLTMVTLQVCVPCPGGCDVIHMQPMQPEG